MNLNVELKNHLLSSFYYLRISETKLDDTWRNGYRCWFPKLLKQTIIWRLQVQSWLQASNNTGILNTCTRLWLTESEQVTPVDSIKDVVRISVRVPEFDKHLKKAGGYIGRNVVEITIKMKTLVRKPLMVKNSNSIQHQSFVCTKLNG